MNNAAALERGTRLAKDAIARHVLNNILVPFGKYLIQAATEGRIHLGNNMTGNTVNSYAVGIYVFGQLVWIETSAGSIPNPLRHKLGAGEIFQAGRQRWDGEIQEESFKGVISNNGTTEPERCFAFLKTYQASPKGWTMVVCNGVEYGTYQENEMSIDVLTNNFNEAEIFAPSFFKPMPD